VSGGDRQKGVQMSKQVRLTEPLVRVNGELRPASWEEALDRAAAGFARAREQDATKSFGMFSCSKATNEMNYAAQKFVRSAMLSNNIDSCNRT
jgi:predicted molibdopterin-dependent oxidoreductase YjgC